jgi:hypothetical protein
LFKINDNKREILYHYCIPSKYGCCFCLLNKKHFKNEAIKKTEIILSTKAAVRTPALPPTTALYPKATCLHQVLIKFDTIRGAMCEKGTDHIAISHLLPSNLDPQGAYRYWPVVAGGL